MIKMGRIRLSLLLLLIASNDAFVTLSPLSKSISKPKLRRSPGPINSRHRLTSRSMVAVPDATSIAQSLGFLIGGFSLFLYTPIAIRLLNQKTAEGLVSTTWWLKLCSYTASDVYAFTHNYPISAWIETLIITIEAAVILALVVYYKKQADGIFWSYVVAFATTVIYLLYAAPPQAVAMGQGLSAVLNTGALIPQFVLNNERQKAGDYSPITAGLASFGCLVRVFTTIQLADSDVLLLASFGIAFILNSALFAQIIYLGTQIERRSLFDVLSADVGLVSSQNEVQSS